MIIPTVIPTSFAPTDPLLHRLQSLRRGNIGPIYEWDPDASVYLAAGEALDGQPLEEAVAKAMNEHLFIAAKQPGTAPIAANRWEALLDGTAINMSGWRTLEAALLPLHPSMPTPTNVNFVQGDYNRTTGLKGDGTAKYINSNHSGLFESDYSLGAYIETQGSGGSDMLGTEAGSGSSTGASRIGRAGTGGTQRIFLNQSSAGPSVNGSAVGYTSCSRSGGSSFSYRLNGATASFTSSVQTPDTGSMYFFARNVSGVADRFADSRLGFVHSCRAIDLAAMDASLTAYMAALNTALS